MPSKESKRTNEGTLCIRSEEIGSNRGASTQYLTYRDGSTTLLSISPPETSAPPCTCDAATRFSELVGFSKPIGVPKYNCLPAKLFTLPITVHLPKNLYHPNCLPFYCLSVYLPVTVYLSNCLPVYLITCLTVYLSNSLPVYLFTCLTVYLSNCLPVYLFTCLTVYLYNCLPI